jgi:hypothetical protein
MRSVISILVLICVLNSFASERWMVATTKVEWTQYGGGQFGPQTNYKIFKRYNVCRVEQECEPKKWVGFLGLSMLNDVSGNEAGEYEAKKFVALASVKTGFMVATPVFGALSFLSASPKGEQIGFDFNSESKVYLGLAVGSLACWWIGSFLESAQVKRVADAFNKGEKLSLWLEPQTQNLGLTYRVGI